MEKIIIPTQVSGDISSCKIENQLTGIEKNSATSLIAHETYTAYNVCTKEVINTYTVPVMTPVSLFLGLFCGFILVAIIMGFSSNNDPFNPYQF